MKLNRPPITHPDEPLQQALCASVSDEEMALMRWSEERKKSFANREFKAQPQHYMTESPDSSLQTIESYRRARRVA